MPATHPTPDELERLFFSAAQAVWTAMREALNLPPSTLPRSLAMCEHYSKAANTKKLAENANSAAVISLRPVKAGQTGR